MGEIICFASFFWPILTVSAIVGTLSLSPVQPIEEHSIKSKGNSRIKSLQKDQIAKHTLQVFHIIHNVFIQNTTKVVDRHGYRY